MDGVTSGGMSGTNGGAGGRLLRLHPWRAGYAICSPLLLIAILVNVTSTLYEVPADVAAWKPFAWELSSFIGCLAALWIPFAALDRVPLPTVRWARAAALHLAAATAFSGLHCTVMWSARRAVYTLMAEPYGWTIPLGKVLYEYRKDLFTYLVISVMYWGLRQLAASRLLGPASDATASAVSGVLDIRDGARLVRAPIASILAAESAGNYVTIMLADGTRPLMRGTLAGLQETLAPHGFLRTHRSFVVNPRYVRMMEPTGAGDYRLTLEGGITVPVSRRYEAARESLAGRK
jgi:hypothetical protein